MRRRIPRRRWRARKPVGALAGLKGDASAMGAPAQIHHRTPMVIKRDDAPTWLDPTSKIAPIQALLARPASAEGEFVTRPR